MPKEERAAITEAAESQSLVKVRRALRLRQSGRGTDRNFKVELLSSGNLEPIVPFVQFALSCLPSNPEVRLGPFNDIEGQISRAGSAALNARVVVWRVEEILPELLLPISHGFPDRLLERIEQARERAVGIVSLHAKHSPGVPLYLSTLATPAHSSNRLFNSQHRAGMLSAIARFNERIYELATGDGGVHVLDLADWAAGEGARREDALMDFMARQPLSAQGQITFSFFLARALRPILFPARKVLALDLDNTLWGGVIGEDGLAGLKLGHDFPGNVHLRIQRELLELRDRGILLVLLSKNNEDDAKLGFEALPDMVLKWDDFVVRKVNWKHKHENLRQAAQELGLGLDSFAFIDDSDYEREQMRQALPEVLVLNEKSDPLCVLRSLWETDAFDSLSLTIEDRQRHHDYAVREARRPGGRGDELEAFLRSLEMEATVEQIGCSNLDRVVAMLGKTNQFNLTTRRHSRADVEEILQRPGAVALSLRLRDKFGDQGIVALLLAIPADKGAALVIDSFLVSCRALGRGVEDTLWAAAVGEARERGYERIEAEYLPSDRNELVKNLYDRLGLRRTKEDAGGVYYRLEPVERIAPPAWLVTSLQNHAN